MNRQTDHNPDTVAHERTLYSVIRYVPSILREEFVNIGVIVVNVEQNNFSMKTIASFGDESRAKSLPSADGAFVRHAMVGLEATLKRVGAEIWTEQRFHELSAVYAANNIQLTPPQPADAAPTFLLDWLFTQLIGVTKVKRLVSRRGRVVIRDQVKSVFKESGLFDIGLEEDYELPLRSAPVVDLAYKNGVWHCYQALAFDIDSRRASQEVNAYRQAVTDARASDIPDLKNGNFAVFTNNKGDATLRADLIGLLEEEHVQVLTVNDAPSVALLIEHDLRAHDLIPRSQA